MIKVYQTISDAGFGDCQRATVASLLELHIDQVPHFIRYDNWFTIYTHFLSFHNIQFDGTGYALKVGDTPDVMAKGFRHLPIMEDSIDGIIMASVNSLNHEFVTHSVLMNLDGEVVHDPSNGNSYNGVNIIETRDLLNWHMLSRTE